MTPATENKLTTTMLSDKMFNQFREFVQKELGIKMPEGKRTLLQGRLQKRLRITGIPTFEAYYDYVFSDKGKAAELAHMMDAVTTNKTDFFREPKHFEYLVETALPTIMKQKNGGRPHHLLCWSAGCSSGKEPYTLGMVLSEFARHHPGLGFTILATDISTKVLNSAMQGIYGEEDVVPVPMPLRKKYLMRSKDKKKKIVRVVPDLRSKIMFRRLNFMQQDYGVSKPVHVIFFRNVLIYFKRPTQELVINRLCRYLNPGGFFFTGHSETLNGLNVPLVQVAPTIYRRK